MRSVAQVDSGAPTRAYLTRLFEEFQSQLKLQAQEIARARRGLQLAREQHLLPDGPRRRPRR